MKKLVLLCIITLMACAGCSGKASEPVQAQPQDYGRHSAMNSLDYYGSYVSERSVSGNEVAMVELSEHGRCRVITASGNVHPGSYSWDVTGSTVRMQGISGQSLQFFVGENYVKMVNSADGEERIFNKRSLALGYK